MTLIGRGLAVASFSSRVVTGCRYALREVLAPPRRDTARLDESIRRAELSGLAFAFHARTIAIVVVTIWLFATVQWLRILYYAAFPGCFFVSGFVPYLLRRWRYAEATKLAFVVLDVVLVTTAILMPPPADIASDWPVQMRLRGQEYLFVLLLLGEAALTYSPRRVLWTGFWIAVLWSLGFKEIYDLPDTSRFADALADGSRSSVEMLALYVGTKFVSLAGLSAQVTVTALLTILLTLAVLRGRAHLLGEVRSDLIRSDLVRYFSPDVASAIESPAADRFGEPTTRTVAVLFADIRGFTGMVQNLPPERAFSLLSGFQARGARTVLRHSGTLDKYLGDGFMATFGAIREEADAAIRAIDSAFDLLREISAWNERRKERGAEPIRVGVGIHFGQVMVGNLGPDQRVEFTVVGDVVNVANRLEQATRELGCALAVSDDCVREAAAAGRFGRTMELALRGRNSGLLVHLYDDPAHSPERLV